jgi:DUF1680 family protein
MMAITMAAILAASGPSAAVPPGAGRAIEPVSYKQVTVGGSFWGPRLAVLHDATLSANRHQCDLTGRLANFDKAAAKTKGDPNPGVFVGRLYDDSDVYKMMQGWAVIVGTETDPAKRADLDKGLDALIARIGAAQQPDGYIDTYYTLKAGLEKRFTREEWDHESYCMGHLIEAGATHFQATGKRNFFEIAIKAADFLCNLYADGKFTTPSGHQEVEIALLKLTDATGDQKYADLAYKIVEFRGRPHGKLDGTTTPPWGDYAQDHKPAAEQHEAAGHAVRAGYMYTAMAELARRGKTEYVPALDSLWEDVTGRRIFVTGGIGPSGSNEGFTVPYDIPTQSAYQETCASISLCLWAHRMFLLEGDAKYMTQFEKTVYNAVLAGVSLDGKQFFYVNPMMSKGGHRRQDWFSCACCPPNVVRFFAELPQYVYAVKGDTVYVNLFMDGAATTQAGGGTVELKQTTAYPFDGAIAIEAKNGGSKDVTLAIRWTPGQTIERDADGYARAIVKAGSTQTVRWNVPMTPTRIHSDPRVKASLGRVAVMRGPLVYAAESIDNSGTDMPSVILPPTATFSEQTGKDGVPEVVADVITVEEAQSSDGSGTLRPLYRGGASFKPAKLTLRPYFMWANRGNGSMSVWLPESAQFLDPRGAPGVKISASHIYTGDSLDAVTDSIEPDAAKGSADQSIPRLTFWPRKGTEEWVMYEFDHSRNINTCSIYWFDDTGAGECGVPASARIEYKEGDEWKPVVTSDGGSVGVKKNEYNKILFREVTTKALRLHVKLQDGKSAGLLEWTFGQ